MTVVTFTANPSLDRTAELDRLVPGAVLRTRSVRVDAGGKGVNVTRALQAHGVDSVAVLPIGGHEGSQLLGLLLEQGLAVRTVPIRHAIRANVTLAEADGTTTKVNEPGPVLDLDEVGALAEALVEAAVGADWVVLAGSLPPGAPLGLYAELIHRVHAVGARVAVDCDGPLLHATLAARPDLVKPNRRELAEATGLEVTGPDDALLAVAALQDLGARAVLASLGSRGAVLADETGTHVASTEPTRPRSTVGAGDAALAGFLAAGARGPEALAEAVAWGAAAVSLPGSRMPGPADVFRSTVTVRPDCPAEEVLP